MDWLFFIQLTNYHPSVIQGSYSNTEMRFQYNPVYSRMDRTQFPGHLWCDISHNIEDKLDEPNLLRYRKTDNPTFISVHPHNGLNISNLRCMTFAVLGLY